MTTPILIYGPTASGKSALALDLAEALNGVVINGDSLQLYKDLEILTARPPIQDILRCSHKMYGVLEAEETCSAGRWHSMATEAIEKALAQGKRPIIVGGTGLYLKSLVTPLSPIPPIDPVLHQECQDLQGSLGQEKFYQELERLDPATALRLKPQDSQRTLRAYVVLKGTGKTMTEWHQETPFYEPKNQFPLICLKPPRNQLQRIAEIRFQKMLDQGALEEVRRVSELYPWTCLEKPLFEKAPLQKALGFLSLLEVIHGRMTLEEATQKALIQTRQYIKRQYTWMNSQLPPPLLTIDALYTLDLKERVINALLKL